jgi:hypothetical protein
MSSMKSVAHAGPKPSGGRRVVRGVALLGLLAISAVAGVGVGAIRGSAGSAIDPQAKEGVAHAAAPEAVDRQAQGPGTQVAERMGPFEYTVNSVLGRYLNVPGTD